MKTTSFKFWRSIAVLLLIQTGLLLSSYAQQQLHGHVPPDIVRFGLHPTGRVDSTIHLNLAIGLPLRNQQALTVLLGQIYDPTSPNYHHYLSPDEFAAQFGPSEQDYQSVIAFAKSNGLSVTATHSNRVLLDVSGLVSDIERVFHVTMSVYQHPTESRTFHAPDVEPFVDLPIPILHIGGLDDYSLPHPHSKPSLITNSKNVRPNAGSGPSGTYIGNDFRAAYVPCVSLNGGGQAVGLLQFDGYTTGDITYYENAAGLPNVTLTNVLLDGFDGHPTGSGGEVEVSLDIEMAISMAPGLSNVIVYEAGPSGNWHDLLNRMATDNLAKQLSCSWYIPGGGADSVAEQIFQQMATQGQSFFDASGDDDAYPGLIDFPGDSPSITQVGGTTLTTTGPGGSWASETVWNWGGGTGSGGGISTHYSIPSWQTGISMSTNQGSTTKRNVPDVALTADNVYVRANGFDYNVGGTSCAAPLWAGFLALVNQQSVAGGGQSVGFINPVIYSIGKGSNYSADFHDITTGNNTSPRSPSKFYAVSGYDLCVGWGTPQGQALINAFMPVSITLNQSLSGGNQIGTIGRWNGCVFPSARLNPGQQILTGAGATEALQGDQTMYSGQKYDIWSRNASAEPNVLNHHTFAIRSTDANFTSTFLLTNNATVQARVLETGSIGGSINFQDPWLIDYADQSYGNSLRNQGMSAPFKPVAYATNNLGTGTSHQGVFLGLDPAHGATTYYSVSAPAAQFIAGYNSVFGIWSGSNASFQNLFAAQTPVVFEASGATLTASYKIHLQTNIASVAVNNNQRKIMQDQNGNYHLVYESTGEIWYTKSTDGGATWSNEMLLSDGRGVSTNPSLNCSTEGYSAFIRVVWVWSDHVVYRHCVDGIWEANQETVPPTSGFAYNSSTWTPNVGRGGWVVYNRYIGNGSQGYIVAAYRDGNGTWYYSLLPGSDNLSKMPSMVNDYYNCWITYEQPSTGAIMYNKVHLVPPSTFNWETTTDVSTGSSRTANGSPSLAWDTYDGFLYVAWHGWNAANNQNEIIVRKNTGSWESSFTCFGSGLPTSPTPPSFYNPVIRDIGSYNMALTWWSNDNTIRAARFYYPFGWGSYNLGITTTQKVSLSDNTDGTTGKIIYSTGASSPYQLQFYNDGATNPWTSAFSNQSTLSGATQYNNQRKLYRESSGTLHEVFESFGEIFYRKSTNGGTAWQSTIEISSGSGGNSAPCIGMCGSTLLAAWQQSMGSNYNIVLRRSTDGGSTWQVGTFLQSNFGCSTPGPLPTISGYSTGGAFIAYGTNSYLSFMKSTNSGSSWTSAAAIPGTSGTYNMPSCAMYRTYWSTDQANVAFASDAQTGSPKIYCSYYELPANSWGTFTLSDILGAQYTKHANPNLAVGSTGSTPSIHVVWDADLSGSRVIVHRKGSFRAFGSTYSIIQYQSQNKPSITGLSSDSAWIVYMNGSGNGVWKDNYYYSGGSWTWGNPINYISSGWNPQISVGSTSAKYLWTADAPSAPYTVNIGSEVLSKETNLAASHFYTRELNIINPISRASFTLEIAPPQIVDNDNTTSETTFGEPSSDSMMYTPTRIGEGAFTAPFTLTTSSNTLKLQFGLVGYQLANIFKSSAGIIQFQLINHSSGRVISTFGNTSTTSLIDGQEVIYELVVPLGHLSSQLAGLPLVIRPIINDLTNTSGNIASLGHVYGGAQLQPTIKLVSPPEETSIQGLLPTETSLGQNYPNPFNPSTTLDFRLSQPGKVLLSIYNVLGQEVARLVDRSIDVGNYSATWDAGSAPSGLYYARMIVKDASGIEVYRETKKVLLMK